jgi:hypothetical protein
MNNWSFHLTYTFNIHVPNNRNVLNGHENSNQYSLISETDLIRRCNSLSLPLAHTLCDFPF